MFIDTHAHLCDDEFKNNLSKLISDLPQNSVSPVFCVGYNLSSSKECVKISNTYKNIYAIIGIHPSEINELDNDALQTLKQLAQNKKVIGIGEIGLDFHYPPFDKQTQIEGLVKQLQLAYELKLPVIIHTRDANQEILQTLKSHSNLLSSGGIIHCFSQDYEFYKEIKSLGFIISVNGTLTFKNATKLQSVIADISLCDIVLETDCPYLTPEPLRGQEKNQPKNVVLVAQQLAKIKNLNMTDVETQTNNNVKHLFKSVDII